MSLATTKHVTTTTTSAGKQCIVRSTTTADPVLKGIWWSNMTTLGWDRSWYDLESYLACTHSRGFMLPYESETGPPRGHVMGTVFDNQTGWVAMFIMASELRRSGFGRVIFQCAMDDFRTQQTKYAGLDGVLEQVPTYERRGFQTSPLGVVKHMSRGFAKPPLSPFSNPDGMIFKDAKLVEPAWIVAFEKTVTGFERGRLWTSEYFARPDVRGVVGLDTSRTGPESVVAFVVVRRCPSGARLGPLYARDADCSETTMAAGLRLATPEFVKACALPGTELGELSEEEIATKAKINAEIWTGNAGAEPLFEKFGWQNDNLQYARMWLDGKATPEQSEGGAAHRTMFSVYDAAIG
ncbi:hypothetical protein K461DRAFT_276800 [Myriangium duriaei CBS 260.36]|uniref:N-acetyltransferase domain-containing protein n=1 Tax=Myriangium duriaei CBS 260.36 TaxID=1168546 RepID=A0A9P4J5C4_9PEZI|nr:hypothetical protein K461DRAFT_276800 [Myriangium duriaei CBS 260.36]